MKPYKLFPDKPLQKGGVIADNFIELGVTSFWQIDLKDYSKELVKGRFPESGAENYVTSADIVAEKPL